YTFIILPSSVSSNLFYRELFFILSLFVSTSRNSLTILYMCQTVKG
uniref:Uncharacterized protein n=1 Tax=Amphimedon queenslandica TaxID=400682 RepID=A0A1X7TTY4_AMPQE